MSENFKKEKLKKLKTDEQKLFEHDYLNKYLSKQSEQREKRLKKNKHTLSCLQDNIKWYNIRKSQRERRERTEPTKKLKKNIWKFQFVEKQQLADIISLANSKKNKIDSSWKSEIKRNYLNNHRKEITHWGIKTILGICFIRNNGSHKTMDSYLLYTRGKKLLTQLSLKERRMKQSYFQIYDSWNHSSPKGLHYKKF